MDAHKLWPLDRASIWKPLDKEKREIRILLLQPSEEEDDALYADLEIVSLDNEPEYKAISYVWGDATDTTVMFMNGGKVIEITRSLAAALRRFRDSRNFAALWADAVCINQADLWERADQVRIMDKIYASAIQVNVWLGRDALSSILDQALSLRHADSLAMLNLLQDVGQMKAAVEAKNLAFKSELCEILEEYSHLSCQNDQDRVYSLLGLSSALCNFPIDYQKTTEEVYLNFAIFCIANEGPETVFLSSTCSEEPSKLPSWVPDWRRRSSGIFARFSDSAKLHAACPAALQGLGFGYIKADRVKLGISAFIVDRLDKCAPTSTDIGILDEEHFKTKELNTVLAKIFRKWQTFFRAFQDNLLQILFCNVSRGLDAQPREMTRADFETVERFWTAIEDARASEEDILRGRDRLLLQQCVLIAQLFLTSSGQPGNAMRGVQAGDLVALFPGCRIPFIIRPAEGMAEQKTFRLISPCYVHGMMYGEALWDAFIAKANPAEKTEFQNEFDATQEKVAAGIEHTEKKALRAELANKHCPQLFEEIVLI
ncbi:hypothetical protein D0869_02563 [Hortaea werneckii]|uniref:Heterokaryon incompatibility domain-containing protein n=1 Tax=Hortaea werneckii TaxID=91943 RepID=A0A3M6X9D2_HORWE|nr:hypothetical protein D0869_02563 [Hortaea werneckii]